MVRQITKGEIMPHQVTKLDIEKEHERLKEISCDDFANEMSNHIYLATGKIEVMEHLNKIRGSGHHIRQEIAGFVSNLIKERWIGK